MTLYRKVLLAYISSLIFLAYLCIKTIYTHQGGFDKDIFYFYLNKIVFISFIPAFIVGLGIKPQKKRYIIFLSSLIGFLTAFVYVFFKIN